MIDLAKKVFLILLLMVVSCEGDDSKPSEDQSADTESPQTYQQYGSPMDNVPDNSDIVMYEANMRAMSVDGDLQGVLDKMDHIESLGVNVIWLMPIYPQGELNSVGSPYAVKDYKAVSTEYGDLAKLRQLTDEAHSRGIAVILDWVANHTSWDNEWIQNTSWYTQNSSGNIIHPPNTNWQDVADLNFQNSDMRAAMIDAMKYWVLSANIDGFRCDYADGVPASFWEQALTDLNNLPNRELIFLAEGERQDHFASGFDLNFGWEFLSGVKDAYNGAPATTIHERSEVKYTSVPAGKEILRFTTNHDESAWHETPVRSFNGKEGALAASVITAFSKGVPLIYSSQEVGTVNNIPFFTNSSINWNSNPDLLSDYQNIYQFYSNSNLAKKGTITHFDNNDVFCLKRSRNSDKLLVIVNIRDHAVNFDIPAEFANSSFQDVLTTNNVTLSSQMTLQPYQYYILKQ